MGNPTTNRLLFATWNHTRDYSLGEKLEGSLLKGSYDKRVRIDLPAALPFPSFSTAKAPPTTP